VGVFSYPNHTEGQVVRLRWAATASGTAATRRAASAAIAQPLLS